MAAKAMRSREDSLGHDSHGRWYSELCDKEGSSASPGMYPTKESQIDLCWRMRRTGFNPDDPGNLLPEALLWSDMAAEEIRWEENEAWTQFLFPELWHSGLDQWHEYGSMQPEAYADDAEYLEEVTYVAPAPEVHPYEHPARSKKRRASDGNDRNKRRDGSKRGHYYRYGVCHRDVQHLVCAGRVRTHQVLRDVRDGEIDPDRVALTAQPLAWSIALTA